MKRLLLIDGSSMLTTNYYGTLPKSVSFEKDETKKKEHYKEILQTKDGVYTNGVFCTLNTILKIINKQQPDYIAVAFDKTRNTFRRELYSEYKGTRKDTPDPLQQQFVTMESILARMGIKVLFSDTYEADDVIGTLARKFAPEIPVSVMTKDGDYLQLVSENISAWMVQTKQEKCDELFKKYEPITGATKESLNLPDKVFEFTPMHVYSEIGVDSTQITDLKGLQGDTSDNIPGVKGITSAAIPLLCEYGSIEKLYEEIHKIGPSIEDIWNDKLGMRKGSYKKLTAEGAEESAKLSKKLATIVDIPNLTLTLEDLKTNINKRELSAICDEYSFTSTKRYIY